MKHLHTIPLCAMPFGIINDQQQDLVSLTQLGPIALVNEEQVAGILLSPAQWAAITQTLEAAQLCMTALDLSVGRKK